jgi:hypothetical protein
VSGHSPGPWRYKPVAVTSHPSEWEQVVLWDATGHSVALIKPGSVGPEDARLIVAAPELLAMLERLVDGETGIVMDEADALIARIKGRR